MTRHVIKAIKINAGNWVLFDMVSDTPIGEGRAYSYETRKDAYAAAEKMWPFNSSWHGKRVHSGYSIEVV